MGEKCGFHPLPSSAKPLDDEDEELLEMLEVDSAEHFLRNVGRAPVRLLGHRFRVRLQTGFGSEVDIFEMAIPVTPRRVKETRSKLYLFDTATNLLRSAVYTVNKAGRATRVETVYSGYRTVDGHSIPGKIERLENGAVALSFAVESSALSPASDPAVFRVP